MPITNTINAIATAHSTTANWSNNGFKITNLGTPTLSTDACTKAYADSVVVPTVFQYTSSPTVYTDGSAYTITHNLN